MNHLAELLQCIASRQVSFYEDCVLRQNQKTAFSVLDNFAQDAAEAICFFAGKAGSYEAAYDSANRSNGLLALPFPSLWIETEWPATQGPDILIGLHLLQMGDETVLMQGFSRQRDASGLGFEWVFEFLAREDCGFYNLDSLQVLNSETASTAFLRARNLIVGFLACINCTNIRRIEHRPSDKLQKTRARRGKKPLFSYWTLEVGRESTGKSIPLGGTHASPRVHLRRGHPRQYAPGKWTWVQPCAVGNKSLGMVHKDYAVHQKEPA